MTGGYLLAPFAQVYELYSGKPRINELITQLCKTDKLHLTNKASDYYSFIEDRKELYGSRRSRYPMYYSGRNKNSDLYITSPALDTTNYIKSALVKALDFPQSAGNIFSSEEIHKLAGSAEYIRYQYQYSSSAATYSVYEVSDVLPKPQQVQFVGSLSCRLFVTHYASQHDLIVPTGFLHDPQVESYDYYPVFDISLNRILIERLGLVNVIDDPDFHKPFFNLLSDSEFTRFCEGRARMLLALTAAAGYSLGDLQHPYLIAPYLKSLDFGSSPEGQPQSAGALADRLQLAMSRAAERDTKFAEALEIVQMPRVGPHRLVVFTATDLEDETFISSSVVNGFAFRDLVTYIGFSASVYSKGNVEIYHVRTSAGSSGLHGSSRISESALKELRPTFAFSVGIAFGLDESTQRLGDVLVSEHVVLYERTKVNPNGLEFRGDKIPTSADVVSLARQYHYLSSSFKVHVGGILSGDKLVNDQEFRDSLRGFDPKGVGGEMESAGIVVACQASGTTFALIKGISDFAVGKTDKAQQAAAQNAFSVLFTIIDRFEKNGVFVHIDGH